MSSGLLVLANLVCVVFCCILENSETLFTLKAMRRYNFFPDFQPPGGRILKSLKQKVPFLLRNGQEKAPREESCGALEKYSECYLTYNSSSGIIPAFTKMGRMCEARKRLVIFFSALYSLYSSSWLSSKSAISASSTIFTSMCPFLS